ncbi:MAG TPA: hypothetical protein VHS96_02550 [Bacteroidia bacterium]|nr:hypothetical protein [Bacteroidia bacterium]
MYEYLGWCGTFDGADGQWIEGRDPSTDLRNDRAQMGLSALGMAG